MEQDRYTVMQTLSNTEGACTQLVRKASSNQLYVRKAVNREIPAYSVLRNCKITGIPRIYHVETGDGKTEVIEEFLNGKTLEEYVRINGFLTDAEARRILAVLCRILIPIHKMGIIHRDIKPANIILSPGGALFLIDFDAAHQYTRPDAEDTVLLGTKGYAAPEQYGYAPADLRSDIYALGVTINRLLNGKMPGDEIAAGSLSRIIRKCTQIDPQFRYADCSQILTDLSASPVPAPAGPQAYPAPIPMPAPSSVPVQAPVPVPAVAYRRREWWRILVTGIFALLYFFVEFTENPFTLQTLSDYCFDLLIILPPVIYIVDLFKLRTRPPIPPMRKDPWRILFGMLYFGVWFVLLIVVNTLRLTGTLSSIIS